MTDVWTKKTIAIIDDDSDVQELLTAFFKPKGCEILLFNDAESALERCHKEGNEWDLVLSDLHLPRESGRLVVKRVKEWFPNLPVILITGNRSAETAIKAIHEGAYDFIVKPIHFPQLQISVQRALHFKNLRTENTVLLEKVKRGSSHGSMIGKSPKFLAALDIARRVAQSAANVFISGQTGTGKEVIARFIHSESSRSKGPFVAINCSAIPENLLESELFGHAKGSFTGATENKAGLFEAAQDGTLFLDEIGDLSLPLQAKLLRVLQEKKIRRVGENKDRVINARVISATHQDLRQAVVEGRFREDLFFRLNVIPIQLPSLRERPEDILPLAESFLERKAIENGMGAKRFSKDAVRFLLEHPWPGNVRELENAIERAVVLAPHAEITREDFMTFNIPELDVHSMQPSLNNLKTSSDVGENDFVLPFEGKLRSLEECTQRYVEYAVKMNHGARDRTARDIGIDRKTLYRKLKVGAEAQA